MATDPHKQIQSILVTNWNPNNTKYNSVALTPTINVITDQKLIDRNQNRAWILIHRNVPKAKPQGIGVISKQIDNVMDLDVRVFGSQGTAAADQTLFSDILNELDRILDSKILSPGTGYTIMDVDGRGPDLSDKTHFIYRAIYTVNLIQYNKARAAQS